MKRLNDYKMRLMFVGFVAAIVIGGGNTKADFTFGEPVNLGPPVNSSYAEWCPTISADGLELYFGSNRPISGLDQWNLWVVTRQTRDDEWGEPVPVGSDINSAREEGNPQLSPDALELYFYSKRPSVAGITDILVTRRPTISDPWGSATNLGPPVNTSQNETGASITADGLELFFGRTPSSSAGGLDIWTTTRATKDDPWGELVKLGPTVNSSASENSPFISVDGLMLLFSSHANGGFPAGGYGGPDIWMTTRPTRNDPWEPAVNPGPPLNTAYAENCPSISPDGRWLYFCDWGPPRPGGYGNDDLWKTPIIPIVDFNGDGIVDSIDMCIMVDHWAEDYSLCDIGPMPWGDGVVDVEDLKVLAEHLFEEINDPTLVAHWPLDEAQGDTAYNSVANCDGTLIGGPSWQPDGGMVGGALQFDGIDDCVITPFILNPAEGKFSVFAWIKGGAPGEAILSQANDVNWLCLDSVEGCLMTELRATGRGAGPLSPSQVVITDGAWHRIGLVWDGSYRRLYVDGAEVAKDSTPLSALASAEGGLYFGAGGTLAPGTFFSGLIDDVRIYNRVVHP